MAVGRILMGYLVDRLDAGIFRGSMLLEPSMTESCGMFDGGNYRIVREYSSKVQDAFESKEAAGTSA